VKDPKTGGECTERRQSKTWQIRYYRNGRRFEESSHSTKKGAAMRLLKLREGDVAKGLPVTPEVGRLRFEEAAAAVVADYKVNGKRTLRDVEHRIQLHLEPFFGGQKMASLTTDRVTAYVAHRQEEGAANATINRELAILKRSFRLAVQAGKLMHRPHIPMLREDNVRRGFFEQDEFEDVRDALPEYLRGVVTLAYYTGWRVQSEILPLTWSQVDREAKTVRLEPGDSKNREARLLPYGLLPELEDVIERQWAERERLARGSRLLPWVFHRDGKRMRDFKKAWKSACKAAGVQGKIRHDFRRTAVRNLTRAGVPDTVAMKITGHKTRSVFDRYNITSETDLREGLGRLAGKEKGKTERSGRVRYLVSR
jgi:integrase